MKIRKGTAVWTERGLEIVFKVTPKGFSTRPARWYEKVLFKLGTYLRKSHDQES